MSKGHLCLWHFFVTLQARIVFDLPAPLWAGIFFVPPHLTPSSAAQTCRRNAHTLWRKPKQLRGDSQLLLGVESRQLLVATSAPAPMRGHGGRRKQCLQAAELENGVRDRIRKVSATNAAQSLLLVVGQAFRTGT